IDQGLEELSDSEILFSKINQVENYTDDKIDDPKSKRYAVVAKTVMERINDLRAEIDPESFDALNVRDNIKKIVDIENIRNRGFNTAINSITSILDTSRMGYQYIENLKNARELLIREYEDTDSVHLPDERYEIRLRYYDNAQLIEERKSYDVQIKSFETEIQHLWDILEVIYQDAKRAFKVNDFEDLAKKNKNRIRKIIKSKNGEPLYEDIAKVWDEISFVRPAETDVERFNRTYIYEKDRIRRRIILMRDKIKTMYDYLYPIERRVMEDRLSWLEKEYYRFDYMINPYHVQPGLLLDVDITSIKRKKATLDAMANVLNEFLHGVSKGFQDAAFASFSRRRSTVREDINQSFGGAGGEERAAPPPASAYLDLINSGDSAAGVSAGEEPKAIPAGGRGLVSASKPRGRSKAAEGGKRRSRKPAGGALREV
ncbi:MAG: cytochrome C oxidase subunit II, partial [Spirochaetaceae bacterium]|nr:cytochrome C oxidase subunit II [Spirochaetaceae bacterium]